MEILYFLVSSFKAGGLFMYAILLVLAVGTAIAVERGMTLFLRARMDARALWGRVEGLITDNRMNEALELCQGIRTPLGKVWASGLQQAITNGATDREIEGAVEEAMLEVLPLLEKRVHYLYSLSNVATLLGLLGTVIGLIRSFSAVSLVDPAQKSALLANGISLALNNTAFGLLVAIVLMLTYSFMQARSARLGDELDEFSVRLVHLLTARKKVLVS
jgi:biopolymer transport protein ExbB/TolQ